MTLTHTIPGELQHEDTLVSSNRQLSAPADLERSRRRASTPRFCQACGGPWVKEIRGGPVVQHTHDCSAVPRRFPLTPFSGPASMTECCGGEFPHWCERTP